MDRSAPDHAASKHVVAGTILSYNAEGTLEGVVDAVLGQTRPPDVLVIVDNGSTDGSTALIDRLSHDSGIVTTVFMGRNEGVGAGHATAWKRALEICPDCTAIWALEHDTVPAPDCLERLVNGLTVDEAGGASSVLIPAQNYPNRTPGGLVSRRKQLRRLRKRLTSRLTRKPDRVQFTFNGTLFPARVVQEVGFPRVDFFVGLEDRELGERIRAAGHDLRGAESARVTHTRRSHGSLPSPMRWYYTSRNQVYWDVELRDRPLARSRAVVRFLLAVPLILWDSKERMRHLRARYFGLRDGLRGDLGPARHRL